MYARSHSCLLRPTHTGLSSGEATLWAASLERLFSPNHSEHDHATEQLHAHLWQSAGASGWLSGHVWAGGRLMRLLPEWIWGKLQLNVIKKKSPVASRTIRDGTRNNCSFFTRWQESRQDRQMWTLFHVAKVVVHLTNTRWCLSLPNKMPAVWEMVGVIIKPQRATITTADLWLQACSGFAHTLFIMYD